MIMMICFVSMYASMPFIVPNVRVFMIDVIKVSSPEKNIADDGWTLWHSVRYTDNNVITMVPMKLKYIFFLPLFLSWLWKYCI